MYLYIQDCNTPCFQPMGLCTLSLHEQLPCIADSSAVCHWNRSPSTDSKRSTLAIVHQLLPYTQNRDKIQITFTSKGTMTVSCLFSAGY